ncbi:ribonuclease Z [Portibacter marinus]|uniref:ribonuclease Z n=1 Tax=Portibacter marinus TaxID=2898660 RepID=UPI001F2832D6|nr:ribonuclease Z [Portibacter marinus]
MSLKLTILGCNSAIPTLQRFTTSQVLSTERKNYLIDCGEGTQIRIKDLKIKKSRIHEIFISHLHGDHFFGLPGLLTSFTLNGRTDRLTLFGPIGLVKFIEVLKDIGSLYLSFPLEIIEIQAYTEEVIFEDQFLTVHTIPLKHRVPTTGFLFKEKIKERNIIPEKIKEYQLTIPEIQKAKKGENIIRENGKVLQNDELTNDPPPPKSYAFCSDTTYDPGLVKIVKNVDLLYHEATYLDELKEKAKERGHSTAKQAANIAVQANVKKLIIGHYSSRYRDLTSLQEEAQSVFPNVALAKDGEQFVI